MNIEKIDVGNVSYPIRFLVGKLVAGRFKNRKFSLLIEIDEEYPTDPIRAGGRSVREILAEANTIEIIDPKFEKAA